MSRRLRLLCLLGILLLAGCSSNVFLYNRLDFIIPWYINGYVDLDRDQNAVLDRLLEAFLLWHRGEELPQYAELLDEIIARLDRPASVDDVAGQARAVEAAWFRLESRAVDWMIELGESLRDEQMAEFIDSLRREQQKFEKKYLGRDDEEYREDTYERFVDTARQYLGRLDDAQRERFEQAAAGMLRADRVWLAERAIWIDRLEDTLQRRDGWQQRIRDDLAERDITVTPEYNRVMEHNLAIIYRSVAETLNSRSEKQDRHLRDKLGDLRDDVTTLIAQ